MTPLIFSFVYCGYCHELPKEEIVRTDMDNVKNICHLELTNLLTKRTLLVIG